MADRKITSPARCSTTISLKRADDLKLGDQILLPPILGGMVKVCMVAQLRLVGDDVEIEAWQPHRPNQSLTTSIGNTFHVVEAEAGL